MHCLESSPAQSCGAAGSQQPLLGTLVFWSGFLGAAPCSALLYVPKVFLPSLHFVLSRALHHHLCFQSEFSLRLIWYINCRVLLYDLDDNILAFFPELINSFTVILSSFFWFFFLFPVYLCSCYLSAAVSFICFFLPVGRHLYRLLNMAYFSLYPLIKSSCLACSIFHITVHYQKVLVSLPRRSSTHT